jgi:hypothetical protein
MFTDEATFRMNSYVKRHYCRICREKPHHEIYEHVRNFQKVNVRYSTMQDNVIGPFVFAKNIIKASSSLICYKYLSLC